MRVTVQKRALNWPQDLDGTMRFVELYVANDLSQVGWTPLVSAKHTHGRFKVGAGRHVLLDLLVAPSRFKS